MSTSDALHGPWQTYKADGYNEFTGVSCPESRLCFAVDDVGDVLSSSDPGGGPDAWRSSRIDPSTSLRQISCPASGLCVAVDSDGAVLSSTDPRGNAQAWSRAEIDPGYPLNDVSCPSTGFCVAVADNGTLFTSTDPTGGTGAWAPATIDPEDPNSNTQLTAVSCPSASLCLVGDLSGNVFTSTNPTGGPSAWSKVALKGADVIQTASCPSTSLCVVTSFDRLFTSTSPSADDPNWQPQLSTRDDFEALDCTSSTLCIAAGLGLSPTASPEGVAFTSNDPTGGDAAWQSSTADPATVITGLSCQPLTTQCVAVDARGEVLTSH